MSTLFAIFSCKTKTLDLIVTGSLKSFIVFLESITLIENPIPLSVLISYKGINNFKTTFKQAECRILLDFFR